MARLSDKEKWDEFIQEMMDAIDVQEYLEGHGVEFTGGFTDKGWAQCHAVLRDDKKASAAVNLGSGYYKDLGGGPSYPFFHFLTYLGVFNSYQEAITGLATELKMKSKMPPTKKGMGFWSRIKIKRQWAQRGIRGICDELNIKEQTLLNLGSVQASSGSDMLVAMPVFDAARLFEDPQVGFVLRNAHGGLVRHELGEGRQPEFMPNKSIGSGGILNEFALRNWDEAEFVIKTEGISDMLTMLELIPEKSRKRFAVITNSDGADAHATPWNFSPHFEGKKVVIAHDADLPGQYGNSSKQQEDRGGALRWVDAAMKGGCEWVVNLQLPYEVAEKKGKDLRDWINEGNTWDDFKSLLESQEKQFSHELKEEHDESNLSEHQQLLRDLEIVVIGHKKNSAISVFNGATMRRFEIKDIDRFSYNKMLLHIGETAKQKIHSSYDGDCPVGMHLDNDVRRAIAEEAGGKEISRSNTIGVGLWESGGRLIAVGAGEWLAMNGGLSVYTTPIAEGQIVDFGEEEESWYDREAVEKHIQEARSKEWREQHFQELVQIFKRWGNHKHPYAENILVSAMMASWMQQVWPMRPWIGIQGESSSGKTVLMECLAQYFGNLACATSNRSEAGIRARVRTSSMILLLDEFEAGRERDKLLNLLMGSTRKGSLAGNLRATASQESVTGSMEVIPWMSAVELQVDKQTERNRYVMFDMESRRGMPRFTVPTAEEWEVLRNKSIAIVMVVWKRALELCEYLMQNSQHVESRVGESYATLCAMYGAVLGYDEDRTKEQFEHIVGRLQETIEEAGETEQDAMLQAILNSELVLDGGRRKTVAELLAEESSTEVHLNRSGIRRYSFAEISRTKAWMDCQERQESGYVFFSAAKNSPVRRRLLRDTEYSSKNLKAILSRIPGAFSMVAQINGPVERGVAIPKERAAACDVKEFAGVSIDDDLIV